ncbi:uncharacterized protein LOC143443166 [Arvicanthis niloticus]|uniref:uncharacterized protein LOC143443166 n=1 Tax=Arvicanthis niloticus TaxID=61156 RepID=UPI00403C4EC9
MLIQDWDTCSHIIQEVEVRNRSSVIYSFKHLNILKVVAVNYEKEATSDCFSCCSAPRVGLHLEVLPDTLQASETSQNRGRRRRAAVRALVQSHCQSLKNEYHLTIKSQNAPEKCLSMHHQSHRESEVPTATQE